jgi:hypothetical protein
VKRQVACPIPITQSTDIQLQLCVFCRRGDAKSSKHSHSECKLLKQINEARVKKALRPITITDSKISWVDLPPELPVQETLSTLKQEIEKLRTSQTALEKEVANVKASTSASATKSKGKPQGKGKGKAKAED